MGAVTGRTAACLFGSFRLDLGERVISAREFPSRKAKLVCEILALAKGKPVSKDRMIELVWGDHLPQKPVATLEQTVSILRSAVATTGAPLILTVPGGYQLNSDAVDVDLVRFDELTRTDRSSSPMESLRKFRAAVALAVGDLIEDEPYAEWAFAARSEYGHRVLRAVLTTARLALMAHAPEETLVLAAQARQLSPFPSVEAYHLSISAMITLGRIADAQALFDEAEHLLSTELGASVPPEMEALRCRLRAPWRVWTAGVSVSSNVVLSKPLPVIPLVGRGSQLDAIGRALTRVEEGGCEFVVIEGQAGMGKTRLLDEIARSGLSLEVYSLACSPASRSFPRFLATRLYWTLGKAFGPPHAAQNSLNGDETVTGLFNAIASVVAESPPTLVLVDDLQHCDAVSLSILEALTRPRASTSFGIVATTSPTLTMAERELSIATESVRLTPLDEHDLGELGIMDGIEDTGGHPRVTAACVEAERTNGVLSARSVEAIIARTHEAGPLGLRVLSAAANLDHPFGGDDAAMALDCWPNLTAETLHRAVDLGLLRLGDDGFAFTDDTTRRVLRASAELISFDLPISSA